MKKYECIIIGAGPAGFSTAINLYNNGITDILIIDKSNFPRLKPCAGYLKNKTKTILHDLGISIEKHSYKIIKGFRLFYKHKQNLHLDNQGLWSNDKIDRKELDFAFYNKLKDIKINILEKKHIKNHDINNNLIVLNKGEKYSYNYLIFADGTSGFSSVYQDKNTKKNIAMQITLEDNKKEAVDIHFGITKKGYAWVSSTGKITNIGFTDIYNPKIDYNKLFIDFTKSLGYKINPKKIIGAFVPLKINKNIIMNDNIYFVGDAVGAADPITLSGVSYALLTGKYAALSIKNNDKNLYLKEIKKLKIKFNYLRRFMYIFYLPSTLFCLFKIGTPLAGDFISYAFDYLFVDSKFDYKNIIHCFFDYIKSKRKK